VLRQHLPDPLPILENLDLLENNEVAEDEKEAMARNVESQPNETRITAGRLVFDELALVTRTRNVFDIIEGSDAEEPDGGGNDEDANDVFPHQLHRPARVSVGSEDDEGNDQNQRPKPTPLDEKHVEYVVLVRHVCFYGWEEIFANGGENDDGDVKADLDVSLDEDEFTTNVKEKHLNEFQVIRRGK